MTESMIVDALQAACRASGVDPASAGAGGVPTPEPDALAIERFQRAMAPEAPAAVPLAGQVAETWNAAQAAQQGMLHRMTALSDMMNVGRVSMAQLTELQYELANFTFQQEIVTNVAKKASDAITTLVKNG